MSNKTSSEKSFPIVVLISGNGTNLQAIIDFTKQQDHHTNISAVISNKDTAFGLQRARNAGLVTAILDAKLYADRSAYDEALAALIDEYRPKLVVLAGFMRILSNDFITHFRQRLINIHPSLLPKYKGLHTHQRVLDAGDSVHGCSVHFVNEELDGGKIIAQAQCTVDANDSVTSLKAKVQQLEHRLYPQVIQRFAIGELP